MSKVVRPVVIFALTGAVLYLAFRGSVEAQAGVISAFSVLMGALWGERAALKIPGEKQP